jgi:multimeric flavodoxin WrbA
MPTLHALGLNCSLKGAGAPSSTDVLVSQVLDELRDAGVAVDGPVRVAALDVKPGVSSDEGPGDDWPELRRRILDADILVFGTPIWLGQPSSIAKRVTERMDAFLSETDDEGRLVSVGRVAVVAVVGNEDGAHHVSAELFQALNDVGFTLPANGVTYWVGEAMGGTDYQDLEKVPDAVASTTATVARNAAHLAGALSSAPYPPAP